MTYSPLRDFDGSLPFEGVSGYLMVSAGHVLPLDYEPPRISFTPEFFPSGFLDV